MNDTRIRDKMDEIFFSDMDKNQVTAVVSDALHGGDDGELFFEYMHSEALNFDDGRLKDPSRDTRRGFALRSVRGEHSALAHSSDLSMESLHRAKRAVRGASKGVLALSPALSPVPANARFYADDNPLEETSFAVKRDTLAAIDAYARGRDARVRQVRASLAGSWQAIEIIRADGGRYRDIRPLVRFNVQITVEQSGRMETGVYGAGGRDGYGHWLKPEIWRNGVDEALRMALVNLDAVAAPAGEMTVVLGPGWPGILLHEAIGHGLEGDFNRKKVAAFSDLVGKQVAAESVSVVDDATLDGRRGSLSMDDEGTAGQSTMLIEKGILTGYMHDRLNARLMGQNSTGNGRRESYAHAVMPRMTNTYMLAGRHSPEEIIAGVDKGLYAVNFGGGQVDITSGKFVFSASEAYRIEKGKIGAPVKGATLIGDGRSALKKVTMVGHDLAMDNGIGTCGKEGQLVPVGVGQPTLRMEELTVGGTSSSFGAKV